MKIIFTQMLCFPACPTVLNADVQIRHQQEMLLQVSAGGVT